MHDGIIEPDPVLRGDLFRLIDDEFDGRSTVVAPLNHDFDVDTVAQAIYGELTALTALQSGVRSEAEVRAKIREELLAIGVPVDTIEGAEALVMNWKC